MKLWEELVHQFLVRKEKGIPLEYFYLTEAEFCELKADYDVRFGNMLTLTLNPKNHEHNKFMGIPIKII